MKMFLRMPELPLLNDNGNADPYPAELEVSGLVGPLKAISVILRDVNHTFPGDMDVLLVGPNGKSVVLMSDQGSNGRLENVDLTFNDAGASLANNNNIGSGTYKPSDNDAQSGDTDNFEATDTSRVRALTMPSSELTRMEPGPCASLTMLVATPVKSAMVSC